LEHFKSDRLYQRLIQLTAGFLDLAEAAKHYPCMKKAWIEFNSEKVQPDIPQIDTAASK
jgi:chromate reductase